MSEEEKKPASFDGAKIEREIRSGRKFSLAEAIGRLGGGDLMKGASPVTLKRQAELELKHYLNGHLVDVEGALKVVLLRRVVESRILLEKGYEQPLMALARVVERIVDSESVLQSFVREVDSEWGRANLERPRFERRAIHPHPDDPYTFESVRNALSQLLEKL